MPRRKVGRCKICAWDKAKEFNRRVTQGGLTSASALVWAESKGFSFDRKTFYVHRDHSVHPADALVTYGERAVSQSSPTVSQTQFYEAIRDIGFKNAMSNPDDVSLTHALKAADSLERRKDRGADLVAALAKMMLGARVHEVVTIEGEYSEVT